MKKILFALFLLPLFSIGQITYFSSTSTPADNGVQAGPTVAVTPPTSMVAGDIAIIVCGYKNSGVTMAMSQTSGQTWTAENAGGGATSGLTIRIFWCRFNGTWGSDPSVTITSGTLAMTVQMHVFRPSTSTNTWSVVAGTLAVYDNSSSSNFQIFKTVANGDMGLLAVISNDDNTYSYTASEYTVAGSSQYRNTQGNDIAMATQYKIEAASQSRSIAVTQATLGADTWGAVYLSFRETSSATNKPKFFIASKP